MPTVARDQVSPAERERLVRVLVAQIFLIFFQGFMIAPLLPRLSIIFGVSIGAASKLVPAYMIPYGCVCLLVGPLADRLGRARVLRFLMLGSVWLPAATAAAASLNTILGFRVVTGLLLGGIAPITLALFAALFPYAERGRPVGWMFGAIAGGMACGATLGPWLESAIGWRGLFILVSLLDVGAVGAALRPLARLRERERATPAQPVMSARTLIINYAQLVSTRRGATVYGLVLTNGAFHGGVFAWLGVYFVERYSLTPEQLGFALLGYGIPGFFLGPIIGRLADRHGRRGMVRSGLFLASACAFALSSHFLPALGATCAVTLLSVGFDLTHPLFAGVISTLDPVRTAQAMAINTFAVFIGMGGGSMIFGLLYSQFGMTHALIVFGAAQLSVALATFGLLDASWR